jgi:hypothetical protein
MERDYDFAVTQLAALPVNVTMLRAYGSDDSGSDTDNAGEELYRAYAALTGVPVRQKEAAA